MGISRVYDSSIAIRYDFQLGSVEIMIPEERRYRNSQFDPPHKNPDGTVTHLGAVYDCFMYAGENSRSVRSGHNKVGALILQTWAIGSSKDMEVAAAKNLLARGVYSKVEVALNGKIVESYK